MKAAAIFASVVAGVIFFLFLMVRERSTERRLPWSEGEGAGKRSASSFGDVFHGINDVIWKPASLIVMAVMLFEPEGIAGALKMIGASMEGSFRVSSNTQRP